MSSSARLAVIIACPMGVPPSAFSLARAAAARSRSGGPIGRIGAAVGFAATAAELVDAEQDRLVRMGARVGGELLDEIERGAPGDGNLRLLAAVLSGDLLVHAARDVDGNRRRQSVLRLDRPCRHERFVDLRGRPLSRAPAPASVAGPDRDRRP